MVMQAVVLAIVAFGALVALREGLRALRRMRARV